MQAVENLEAAMLGNLAFAGLIGGGGPGVDGGALSQLTARAVSQASRANKGQMQQGAVACRLPLRTPSRGLRFARPVLPLEPFIGGSAGGFAHWPVPKGARVAESTAARS